MSAAIKLSELAVGSSGLVRDFSKTGQAFIRLREMGLLAGTRVTLVRVAPMGDPIELKVRGYHLTIRKSEADQVLVEPVA